MDHLGDNVGVNFWSIPSSWGQNGRKARGTALPRG